MSKIEKLFEYNKEIMQVTIITSTLLPYLALILLRIMQVTIMDVKNRKTIRV